MAADMLRQFCPLAAARLAAGVTDVASVKGSLRAGGDQGCGEMPPQLVLGHPIAGSERSGVDASEQILFATIG